MKIWVWPFVIYALWVPRLLGHDRYMVQLECKYKPPYGSRVKVWAAFRLQVASGAGCLAYGVLPCGRPSWFKLFRRSDGFVVWPSEREPRLT